MNEANKIMVYSLTAYLKRSHPDDNCECTRYFKFKENAEKQAEIYRTRQGAETKIKYILINDDSL